MLAHIISALVIGMSSLRNNLQAIVLAHIIFLAAHQFFFPGPATVCDDKLNPAHTPRRYASHSIEDQDIDFSIRYFIFVL
jgi:hypothetical protein